jgi:ATP-dependent Lon protease
MRRLPLFPLPVVLFPRAVMPLHIFEPRYRQMVARCLEFDRRFGLVYHDPDRMGPFQMEAGRVGTVAEIGEFRPLPDGRSLLLAHGRERFRIEDGVESDTLYYEAVVSELPDAEPGDEEALFRSRQRSVDLFRTVLDRFGPSDPEGGAPELRLDPAEEVSFRIASWIRLDPSWQDDLLAEPREEERLRRIDGVLLGVLGSKGWNGGD